MTKLSISHSVFIQTKNVRDVVIMMDDLGMDVGEGKFGVVYGKAGLGKSETIKWYHANHNNTIYLESTAIWISSELEFLRDFCFELGIENVASRKGRCFNDINDYLFDHQDTIIFIDEAGRLKPGHLELMRDITRVTTCPIVLIGEHNLMNLLKQGGKDGIQTRTFSPVKFSPMKQSDVIIFAKEAIGVQITADVAAILHKTATKYTTDGNFRLVKRALHYCVQYANAKNIEEITPDIATDGIKAAIRWAKH